MRGPTHAEGARGAAVVLVRNAVDHDSRVLREAGTLKALGLETTILGVVSFTQTREVTERDGVVVRRLGPRSRVGWRIYHEISNLRPGRRSSEATQPAAPGAKRSTASRLGGSRRAARRLLRWLSTLAYYARATRAVRELRPDIVHCNDYNTMWVGIAARALCGSALVYDSHELWADRNLRAEPRPWLVACEALFTRVADSVVTTSPAYAKALARRYRIPRPVVVRNIPTHTGGAAGGAADGAEASDPDLAVYVGGLQPGRGLETAIRALPLAPRARLRLLGPATPEYRAELLRIVRDLGLEERVEFADPVPPEALIDTIRGAGVGLALIQPTSLSYRLTLPNKLFEYTLAGLPIIGSNLPMIALFVEEHGVGLTADPDDVDAVARVLREMLEPGRADRFRTRAERAAAALDGQTELQILAEVYRDALAARGRGTLVASAAPADARGGGPAEN